MVDYEEEDDYGEDEGAENILKPIQTVDGLFQTMDDDDAEINQLSPTEYAEENIQQSIKTNVCSSGIFPSDTLCQNTASQIQGDDNSAALAGNQNAQKLFKFVFLNICWNPDNYFKIKVKLIRYRFLYSRINWRIIIITITKTNTYY